MIGIQRVMERVRMKVVGQKNPSERQKRVERQVLGWEELIMRSVRFLKNQ
jgi:hypothetical protein